MDYELLIIEINDSFFEHNIFMSTFFSYVTLTDITLQFCALPVLVPFLISKESDLRVRNFVRYEVLDYVLVWNAVCCGRSIPSFQRNFLPSL
jgi:hypothetical protein